uniref:Uncharacterized protein n=1 Tax=Anguilla anguilla TaxID=7936 RepID=A0A0E9TQ57_ANGAN
MTPNGIMKYHFISAHSSSFQPGPGGLWSILVFATVLQLR